MSRFISVDWRDLALCRQTDLDFCFPDQGQNVVAAAAKAMCRRCPAVDDCLDWALEIDQRHGIWGGMSPGERDLESERRAKARKTTGASE